MTFTSLSITGSINASVSASAPLGLTGGATLSGSFAITFAMSVNSANAPLVVTGGLVHVPGLDINAGFTMSIGTAGVTVAIGVGNIALKSSLAANAPNLDRKSVV